MKTRNLAEGKIKFGIRKKLLLSTSILLTLGFLVCGFVINDIYRKNWNNNKISLR